MCEPPGGRPEGWSGLELTDTLRFGLIPWQFQNRMFKPMKMIKGYLSWMVMHYSGLLGGFRLLGDSLGGIARRRGGF